MLSGDARPGQLGSGYDRYTVPIPPASNSPTIYPQLLCSAMKLLAVLLWLATLRPCSGGQTPLSAIRHDASASASSANANAPFIFSSVQGLLRQLPNTFSPNGFSIVAATVPAWTNLYHARKDAGAIPKVEWVAFDAEMSYGIMGGRRGETWLHTFVTTRDVRVLVFDGMSAALRTSGTLDSQSVFLDGAGDGGPPLLGEYARATALCEWARGVAGAEIEGFVRMNTGFEMIWCDFEASASWRRVSKLNVTARDGARPPSPPGDGRGLPWAGAAGWEWIRSATWHYARPESRVVPDLCRFFTFYDTGYASFPRGLRGPRDSSHRLVNVTAPDAAAFRARIGRSLGSRSPCSGFDWRRVAHDVVDRYGGRIRELQLVLAANATDAAKDAGRLAFAAVMPFVSDSRRAGALRRCALAHTGAVPQDALSPQEALIRSAVETVVTRICATFLRVYFGYLRGAAADEIGAWRAEVDGLVAWLDWDVWRTCEPSCARNEVCAGALWPMLGRLDAEEWSRPRCVNSSVVEHGRSGGRRDARIAV